MRCICLLAALSALTCAAQDVPLWTYQEGEVYAAGRNLASWELHLRPDPRGVETLRCELVSPLHLNDAIMAGHVKGLSPLATRLWLSLSFLFGLFFIYAYLA